MLGDPLRSLKLPLKISRSNQTFTILIDRLEIGSGRCKSQLQSKGTIDNVIVKDIYSRKVLFGSFSRQFSKDKGT